MSDKSESGLTNPASTNESESSSSFRSFWKKSDRPARKQEALTFVQQDPANKRKPSRISRLLKTKSGPSSQGEEEESTQTTAQKRRDQVYQAQKRHRNRKAEYVQNLEAEVARLQHLDAIVNSEKNALAHQNNAIKEFLAKQSLEASIETMSLSSSWQTSDELSQLGGATVDVRWDPDLEHERVFLDFLDTPDMLWTPAEPADAVQLKRPVRNSPVAGDSWAALDFILALEWPCKDHTHHHAINPIQIPEGGDADALNGHALTTMAAVYQSSLSPSESNASSRQSNSQPSTSDKWQLPHSEIDKLVELSEMLELDEEAMTPAQAYSAVRQTVPTDAHLRPTLEALKKPLGSLAQCHGYGTCIDSAMFWQHLEATMQTLQFTRPELAQS